MGNDLERIEREARAGRLVWARREAGLRGPKAASDKFGWNVNTYKAHEQGRNGFGVADAKKYAKAFGVSLSWLNFNEGEPFGEKSKQPPYVDFGDDEFLDQLTERLEARKRRKGWEGTPEEE